MSFPPTITSRRSGLTRCGFCTCSSALPSTTSTGTSKPRRSSKAAPVISEGSGGSQRTRPTQLVRSKPTPVTAENLTRAVHRTIARVTADIERYAFNTAVAACMELTNVISRHARSDTDRGVIDKSIDTLLELLAPFAPHLAAEAYEHRHGDNVHTRPWPVADVRLLTEQRMTMIVQVNGKLKDRIEVERDISEHAAAEAALASARVQAALGGASPKRVIAKPPRLVNIIV